MKYFIIALFTILSMIPRSWEKEDSDCRNSAYLLKQSKAQYDPQGIWDQTEIRVHIQEPRIQNPYRYTKLILNRESEYFEFERIREDGIEKRIIDEVGKGQVFFNGSPNIPQEVIEKHRLTLERSKDYRNFYQIFYGLPMSLNTAFIQKMEPAETVMFRRPGSL